MVKSRKSDPVTPVRMTISIRSKSSKAVHDPLSLPRSLFLLRTATLTLSQPTRLFTSPLTKEAFLRPRALVLAVPFV